MFPHNHRIKDLMKKKKLFILHDLEQKKIIQYLKIKRKKKTIFKANFLRRREKKN